MFDWMAGFESLGSNCEFAFVLERCGIDQGSLLRFAESFSMRPVDRAIAADFAGLYQFENLHPFNADMVVDRASDLRWHSTQKSVLRDPALPPDACNFRFVADDTERRRRWDIERDKMAYLAARTRANLAAGNTIFVYRLAAADSLREDDVEALFHAVNLTGRNHLLIVTAGDAALAGSASLSRPGLMRGHVDRFAPGHLAGNVSFASWLYMCRAAYDLAQASGH